LREKIEKEYLLIPRSEFQALSRPKRGVTNLIEKAEFQNRRSNISPLESSIKYLESEMRLV
jgi:hypothetical protein